ncbi:MAG: FAD-dependent oxidoreductase [Bdellovibrionales bacterium]|nr:FAD-dependent oxidoreductase [Bdellovibrionales bacterium]
MKQSMRFGPKLIAVLVGVALLVSAAEAKVHESDVVIYAATPAGIAAGAAAAREGLSVIIIDQDQHIGGMMSSGLGASDRCDHGLIGGISKSVFNRIGRHYGMALTWHFEPHVAENVFEQIIKESGITVIRQEVLSDVKKEGNVVKSITTDSGDVFQAKVFLDASYEGDLYAAAGVSYAVGREPGSQYSEQFAGVQPYVANRQFPIAVPAKDKSGRIYHRVNPKRPAEFGSGDKKIMAYNYRLCMTKERENFVPISKPKNYRAEDFELFLAFLQRRPHTLLKELFHFFPLKNKKFDVNNRIAFSTDFVGANWDYPEANADERSKIAWAHRDYTQGLFYFLGNDERVPPLLRKNTALIGLCKDEFADNDNWPYELYVREARRMVGEYVLTEKDLLHEASKPDSVARASCPLESHHVDIHMDENGNAMFEGWVGKKVKTYEIPYRSLLPKRSEAANLLVPVAISASHVAYSSLRMEPTYMMLGEGAGIAAALSLKHNVALHDLDYQLLLKKLNEAKLIVHSRSRPH